MTAASSAPKWPSWIPSLTAELKKQKAKWRLARNQHDISTSLSNFVSAIGELYLYTIHLGILWCKVDLLPRGKPTATASLYNTLPVSCTSQPTAHLLQLASLPPTFYNSYTSQPTAHHLQLASLPPTFYNSYTNQPTAHHLQLASLLPTIYN